MEKKGYNKSIIDVVMSANKKAPDKISVNFPGRKAIIENKEVVNWTFLYDENNCFISLKQRTNLLRNSEACLSQQAKDELDRISKPILDKTNIILQNLAKVI